MSSQQPTNHMSPTSARPNLSFTTLDDQAADARAALRYEALLKELWRSGNTEETRRSAEAIALCAHKTLLAGEKRAAARLYTELARALESIGEFDSSRTLVAETLAIKEQIDRATLNEVMRLRARLALDAGDTADALAQIRKVERPILTRTSTIMQHRSRGHISLVRDTTGSGEMTREREGKQTPPTLILEAEICLYAQDYRAARAALDEAAKQLLDTSANHRNPDDTAMLQLLRLLDPERPVTASRETLLELAEVWSEKRASAPVIARIQAAAGEVIGTHAINQRERDRFLLLGKEARLQQQASSQATAGTARQAQPDHAQPLDIAEPDEEERKRIDREISQITEDDLQELFSQGTFAQTTGGAIASLATPTSSSSPVEPPPAEPDPAAEAPGTTPLNERENIIERGKIGEGAFSFYNILQNIQDNNITGTLHLTGEDHHTTIYFADGHLAHAEREGQTEDDARAIMKSVLDQADAKTPMSYVVEKSPTLNAPQTLLPLSSSNWGRLLAITSGAKVDETEPDAKEDHHSQTATATEPTTRARRAPSTEPARQSIPDLNDHLAHILKAQDVPELAARLNDAAAALGAQEPEVEITVSSQQLAHQTSSGGGDLSQQSPEQKKTLVYAHSPGQGLVAVHIKAAASPPDASLTALSHLSHTARFIAETLPKRGIDPNVFASELIGVSSVMLDIKELIHQIAPADGLEGRDLEHVLITGESGTGKEIVARLIHQLSGRGSREMPVVNMTTIGTGESGMADSTIFGHKKGSFTGASAARPGKIKLAEHSSLFLDEIGEVGSDMQAKLLRVIEYKDYTPVGSDETETADVRFLMATNKDIRDAVIFRTDLFNRVAHIHLPPLRTRREDIPLLVRHFANQFELNLSEAAIAYLSEKDWPGNVRQLQRIIKTLKREGDHLVTTERAYRAWLLVNPEDNPRITATSPTGTFSPSPLLEEGKTVSDQVESYKILLLRTLYEQSGSNISACVERSGYVRNTLSTMLRKYGITGSANEDVGAS